MAEMVSDRMAVAQWVDGFDRHAAHLDTMAMGDLQSACDLVRGKLDAIEARRLAGEVGADGDDRRARKQAAANGRRSKRAARAAARRAAAVSKNEKLADDLASGDLSSEQFDAIADAAASDESAATDDDFIDEIKKRNADQARKLAAKRKHQSRPTESEEDKQRRLRRASRWKDFESGLSILQLSGDDATIEEIWTAVLAREKQLKQQDGGRDLLASQHPRTFDQRLFDAAIELLRGTGTSSGTPSIVIGISAETGEAHIAGGGPVSDAYVRSILERANLSVLITDHLTGTPLWLGRKRRRASDGQVLALIVRDEGCVLCGAHWVHCEAHHVMPWNAPAKGETNINDLALLCSGCHHQVHDDRLTITNHDGVWTTRPARNHEIAPQGAQRRSQPRTSDHRTGNRKTLGDFGPTSAPRRTTTRRPTTNAAHRPTAGTQPAPPQTGPTYGSPADTPIQRARSNTSRSSTDGPSDPATRLF
jgi:hypothetical protein